MPAVIISVFVLVTFIIGPLLVYLSARLTRIPGVTLLRTYEVSAGLWLLGAAGLAARIFLPGSNTFPIVLVSAVLSLAVAGKIVAAIFRVGYWRGLLCYLGAMLMTVGVALGIRVMILEAFMVPTFSMSPTLIAGDRVVVDKLTLRFRQARRGEVVVFRGPHRPEEAFIKRIVAVPGDRVDVRDDTLFVNGDDNGPCKIADIPTGFPPVRYPLEVPSDRFFLMGDNRSASLDSRYWGPVDAATVTGLAGIIYASVEPASLDLRPELDNTKPISSRWSRIGTIVK